MPSDKPLTGKSTIGEWLDHPAGGAALRNLLAAGGQDAGSLAPVQGVALRSLVQLSQGAISDDIVNQLVRAVNDGALPSEEDDLASGCTRFVGKTVIITGAGSGIGRATATRILREGGRVVAVDVVPKGIEELAASAPDGSVVTVVGDVTKEGDIERIVEAAGSGIDGLANVAGIMDGMLPLHEVPDDVWARVLAVNVDGPFRLTRAVLPVMLAAGTGSIVNVTSEASLRGNAAGTAYTVSKHAVNGLTKSAAFLYGRDGIRVNAVAPGPTATGISGDFKSEFGRQRLEPFLALIPPVTDAATIAASITWLLSDDSANVNGQIVASDGGWSVQ